jgi:hypothetical protein
VKAVVPDPYATKELGVGDDSDNTVGLGLLDKGMESTASDPNLKHHYPASYRIDNPDPIGCGPRKHNQKFFLRPLPKSTIPNTGNRLRHGY